jgi:hypothetical protein
VKKGVPLLSHFNYLTTNENMKHYIYLIAMVAFIAAGCSKNNPVAPTDAANHMSDPTSAKDGGTSDACFDIPAPIMQAPTQTTISTVGGTTSITVCWKPATPAAGYYTGTTYFPQGTGKPARWLGFVPTAALNPTSGVTLTPGLSDPHAFWGGSQRSIVSKPSYSGHYEGLEKQVNGGSWTAITGDSRDECYTDNNGGAGYHVGDVVSYRVSGVKSLEGSSPNQCTHHAKGPSDPSTITVCGPITGPIQFDGGCATGVGGNGTWNGCTWTSNTCKNTLTPTFRILEHNTIEHTCDNPHTYTQDGASFDYTGNICVSTDGTTWVAATWVTDHYEVSLANAGPGSYTAQYSTTCDGTGVVATSTYVVPDCDITGESCHPELPANNHYGAPYGLVGSDGNYPTHTEGDFRWNSNTEVEAKSSSQQWNSHFDFLWTHTNDCDQSSTLEAVTCTQGLDLFYCLIDPNNSANNVNGTTGCTGGHYNMTGNNHIPNPQVGVANDYILKIATDAACTNVVWTINFHAIDNY